MYVYTDQRICPKIKRIGTSDPYVKFKLNGRLLYKSKTVHKDLNPVWDETFIVPIEDPFQSIQIKVFDYDWGLQDDFMGSALLDLTTLELSRVTELMIPLEDSVRPSGTNVPSKSKLNDIRNHIHYYLVFIRSFQISKMHKLVFSNLTQVCIKLNATLWPRTQEDKELVNFYSIIKFYFHLVFLDVLL